MFKNIYPDFAANYPSQLQLLINKDASIEQLCDYIEYAWYAMMDLEDQDTYDAIWSDTCIPLATHAMSSLVSEDKGHDYFVSSGYYKMVQAALSADSTATDNIYTALQTMDSKTLFTYGSNFFAANQLDSLSIVVLPPSSNMVIELTTDEQVNGYFNDVQLQIDGCSSIENCTKQEVLVALAAKTAVASIDACNNTGSMYTA